MSLYKTKRTFLFGFIAFIICVGIGVGTYFIIKDSSGEKLSITTSQIIKSFDGPWVNFKPKISYPSETEARITYNTGIMGINIRIESETHLIKIVSYTAETIMGEIFTFPLSEDAYGTYASFRNPNMMFYFMYFTVYLQEVQ